MDLPIRFPSEVEVIDEDVARFRELSAEERVLLLDEMFSPLPFLAEQSPKPEALARFARDDENRGRDRRFEKFVKRHG